MGFKIDNFFNNGQAFCNHIFKEAKDSYNAIYDSILVELGLDEARIYVANIVLPNDKTAINKVNLMATVVIVGLGAILSFAGSPIIGGLICVGGLTVLFLPDLPASAVKVYNYIKNQLNNCLPN